MPRFRATKPSASLERDQCAPFFLAKGAMTKKPDSLMAVVGSREAPTQGFASLHPGLLSSAPAGARNDVALGRDGTESSPEMAEGITAQTLRR